MTLLTGDEFFPGGMGEFHAPQNQYLVFEDGPSVDVTLQWATYRDASDQCSLSRIWGGIHPPVDDMPGRLIGRTVGITAFHLAEEYFAGTVSSVAAAPPSAPSARTVSVYPNPAPSGSPISIQFHARALQVNAELYNVLGQRVLARSFGHMQDGQTVTLGAVSLPTGFYVLRLTAAEFTTANRIFIVR